MRQRPAFGVPVLAAALCAVLWAAAAATRAGAAPLQFPRPSGYVNDFAGVLDASARAALERRLADYDRRTGNQIAVAVFPDLGGAPIDDFTSRLEEAWKVGRRGKDDGVLLVVGLKEHAVRIEVGYGLESKITDADAGAIIRNQIAPAFRQGRYADGLNAATDELMRLIGGSGAAAGAGGGTSAAPPTFTPIGPVGRSPAGQSSTPWWLPLGIFLGFALLISSISRASGRRCPRCRARMHPQPGGASALAGAPGYTVWVCPRCGYRERVLQQGPAWVPGPMWAGGGWGSGGFSGSGGEGGFGGFGGGSSGGGGASGSW